jgi:enamine deaminase RidA (YjgF/YER057c/UK114 family)
MNRRHVASFSLALALALAAPPAADAAEPAPTREHLAPAGWEDSYHDWHYSPVVVVGDTIIVSGIPAAVGDTYEAKVRWMFAQLEAHLAKAGATTADVVELTSFHANPKSTAEFREEFARFAKIHHEVFPDHYPAWTAVGTTALLAKDAPVELRAVAIRGSGARPRADIPRPTRAQAPAEAAAQTASTTPADVAHCAAQERWAPNMAYGQLKNEGVLTPDTVDFARTEVEHLATERKGPDLYEQRLRVTFHRHDGTSVAVLTRNDVSSEECSMSAVAVERVDATRP